MSRKNQSKVQLPTPSTPEGFTPKEAATILNLSPKSIRKSIRKGTIEATKTAGHHYITPSTIQTLLKAQATKASPAKVSHTPEELAEARKARRAARKAKAQEVANQEVANQEVANQEVPAQS